VEKTNEECVREQDIFAPTEVDEEWLDLMMIARAIGLTTAEVRQFIHSQFQNATVE